MKQKLNKGLTTAQKATKIKYAKEFFVSETGEVIKIAAIISQNPAILASLEAQEKMTAGPKKKEKKDEAT